ncbi:MAG: hypothetical protein AB1414_10320 [bacterium]
MDGRAIQFRENLKEWKDFIQQGGVNNIECQAYKNIIRRGKEVLPYIMEELPQNTFLNTAIEEITKLNLFKDSSYTEEERSKMWLDWWENNTVKKQFLGIVVDSSNSLSNLREKIKEGLIKFFKDSDFSSIQTIVVFFGESISSDFTFTNDKNSLINRIKNSSSYAGNKSVLYDAIVKTFQAISVEERKGILSINDKILLSKKMILIVSDCIDYGSAETLISIDRIDIPINILGLGQKLDPRRVDDICKKSGGNSECIDKNIPKNLGKEIQNILCKFLKSFSQMPWRVSIGYICYQGNQMAKRKFVEDVLLKEKVITKDHCKFAQSLHTTGYIRFSNFFNKPDNVNELIPQIFDMLTEREKEDIAVVISPWGSAFTLAMAMASHLTHSNSRANHEVKAAYISENLGYPNFFEDISEKRVILIDEVIVSGNILEKCSLMVKKKGGTIVAVQSLVNLNPKFTLKGYSEIIPESLFSEEHFEGIIKVQPYDECELCKKGENAISIEHPYWQ